MFMSNVLFVQFYGKWKVYDDYHCIGVSNGFSDTYDLCNNKGDFLWVNHECDSQLYSQDEIIERCKQSELPISKGTIYISSTTTTHQYQSYLWAKKYPNIKFIVGGPAIVTKTSIYDKDKIPKNLIFTENSVEQIFNVPDFSYEWKLKFPKELIEKDQPLYPCYTITNHCYWGKCIFCKYSVKNIRKRKNFDFQFKDNLDKIRSIFLYAPTMPLKTLKHIIPKLPKNKLKYSMFLRTGKKENEILREILNLCKNGEGPPVENIRFQLGVEFPGNRMLKYMNKGTTTTNILETLNIIKEYKTRYHISFILGWPNLTNKDVDEVEQFVNKAPRFPYNDDPFVYARIWMLLLRPRTPVYNMFEKNKDIFVGPFYVGNGVRLTKEQVIMNNKVRNLLLDLNYTTTDNYTKKIRKEYRDL